MTLSSGKSLVSPVPRVLVISQRNLSDQIANACLYDFEDLLCDLDDVDLVAPGHPIILRGKLYRLARRAGLPRSLARAAVLRQPEVAPARTYDLLLAVLDSYRQVATVHAVRQWRERSAKAICFLAEIWPKDLTDQNKILELFDVFDHVFVGVDHCVEKLQHIVGKPCSNLHSAVDTLQFCPRPNQRRAIDVCYIGRRSPVTHGALLSFARKHGLFYYHDTVKGALRVADHSAHRLLFANLVKHSRYFIANYAKIDQPVNTGGMQEVGYRFFEGAAGGTVMLGAPPRNSAFKRLFPWPDAVIETPFDAPSIGEVIESLDADPERVERIRTANVIGALRHHDWLYRYEQMLSEVGLQATPAMLQRRERLRGLADRIESGHDGAQQSDVERRSVAPARSHGVTV